ncbi:MAG: phosphoglycerate kinase [Parcubacteria group bacterium]|jgi:3-phosphoglycerate kinase
MKKIQNADLKDKKVLLRVDFNVSLEKGDVKEKYKIRACRESLIYLMSQDAKVALLTYFGRPGGKKDPRYSLDQIKDDVEDILDCKVKFVSDCIGEEVKKTVDNLEKGEVALLENVRFYSEEGDVEKGTSYDPEFAKKLADGFDIFINEAFSQSHRNQASITGIENILPSYAGLWLQKEIEHLDRVKNNPQHPAVAIIGGAKIETKLPLIKSFEESYDNILVGGKIANEAIDEKITFGEKVMLPVDFSGDRLDIGKETIKNFSEIIKNAKTIVWNGPMGKFEESPYDLGTKEILKAVIESGEYSLLGGGESVEILEKENAMEKISFVSTGGGAMLEYLSGNPMPGLEALND